MNFGKPEPCLNFLERYNDIKPNKSLKMFSCSFVKMDLLSCMHSKKFLLIGWNQNMLDVANKIYILIAR
jgi:hypothetical protein